MIRRSLLVLLVVFLASLSFSQSKKQSSQPASTQPSTGAIDEKLFGAMRWRQVGPFRGGRVLAVTGVPGEPNVFYFGGASTGILKSRDAAPNWHPTLHQSDTPSLPTHALSP